MIVYIHGFNSSGESKRGKVLKEMFPDIEVYTPSYDSENFDSIDDMILDIKGKINSEKNILFIGSSLGGYIAQYLSKLFNCKSVLLNPCIQPKELLTRFIGKNIRFNTNDSYYLTIDNINKLDKYHIKNINFEDTNISIFLNSDDNMLEYTKSLDYYNKINRPVKVFSKGGHRFDNIQDIRNDIIRIHNMPF